MTPPQQHESWQVPECRRGEPGARVKARENPFASERVLERVRYRPTDLTWDELMARLAALRYRAAIVGPHGTGKTTLMEDLAPRLEAIGFRCRAVTLRSDERRLDWEGLRGLSDGEIVLLDGAEQLAGLAWQTFRLRTRGAGGVIVTTHQPGRLPTLLRTAASPALLREIVGSLVGPAAAAGVACERLLERHGGNVREALRELYDRWPTGGAA